MAAGDGVLDNPMSFVVVVNYRTRSVLQEWNFFNWHAEPPVMLAHSVYIDDSARAPYGIGAKRYAVGKTWTPGRLTRASMFAIESFRRWFCCAI